MNAVQVKKWAKQIKTLYEKLQEIEQYPDLGGRTLEQLADIIREKAVDYYVEKMPPGRVDRHYQPRRPQELSQAELTRYRQRIYPKVFPSLHQGGQDEDDRAFILGTYYETQDGNLDHPRLQFLKSWLKVFRAQIKAYDIPNFWSRLVSLISKQERTKMALQEKALQKASQELPAYEEEIKGLHQKRQDLWEEAAQSDFQRDMRPYYEQLRSYYFNAASFDDSESVYTLTIPFYEEAEALRPQGEAPDEDAVEQEIKDDLALLMDLELDEKLAEYPLALLTAYFPTGNCFGLMNKLRLSHIKNWTTEDVVKHLPLAYEEAEQLLALRDNMIEELRSEISINLINSSHDRLVDQIVEKLMTRQQQKDWRNQQNKVQQAYEEWSIAFKNSSLKNLTPYEMAQLSDIKRIAVETESERLASLYHNLQQEQAKCEALKAKCQVEETELFQYKVFHSADIYAYFDNVAGLDRAQQTGGLAQKFIEKIQSTELITTGLNKDLTLRPYQRFGAQYALYHKRTLLGDEMGLGKTIQALAVANHLDQKGQRQGLILAPLSVLYNWQREIEKWTSLKCHIYREKNRPRALRNWQRQGGLLLTNYEQCAKLEDQVHDKIDLLIVDEAHMIKNPKAQRTQKVLALAEATPYVLLMTGTPLENKLGEMKHLLRSLNQSLLKVFGDLEAQEEPEFFKNLITSVYLRRKRSDVLRELPKISFIDQWSNFSKMEAKYYKEAVEEGNLMKMRRAAFFGQQPRFSGKIEQLKLLVEEAWANEEKVVIFSFFRDVLNTIHQLLGEEVIGQINGDVKASQRQKIIDDFTKSTTTHVLLCQINSAGQGLNIQAANIVILCEPQWKPSTEQQAISRVYRMGQTLPVTVYHLLTEHSIDESMVRVLETKEALFAMYANDSQAAEAFLAKEKQRKQADVQEGILAEEKARVAKNALVAVG